MVTREDWRTEICRHCRRPGETCLCLREIRLWKTPEGRKQWRDEYGVELQARILAAAKRENVVDLPFLLKKLGVPGRLIAALQTAGDSASIEAAKQFIATPPAITPFLVLLGPYGCGKSLAAAYALEQLASRHPWNSQATGADKQPMQFVEASRLTGITAWADDTQRWLQSLEGLEVLVLDDVGDEASAMGVVALRDLLLRRYAANRRTVITGNLGKKAFVARYGEALGKRFGEGAISPDLFSEPNRRKGRATP